MIGNSGHQYEFEYVKKVWKTEKTFDNMGFVREEVTLSDGFFN